MRIHTKCLTVIGLITLLAWQGSMAQAQDNSDQDKPAQADQVLRALCQYYSQLKSFSVEVAKQTLMESGGIKSVRSETIECSLARPNRLSIVLKHGQLDSSIISDGQTITSYIPTFHQYRQSQAPDQFDQVFEQRQDIGSQLLYSIPLIQALITTQPYDLLKRDMYQVDYLASAEINGRSCHQLRIETYPFRIQVWIQQGQKPLLMRIVSDLESYQQDPLGRGDVVELRWEFNNWQMNRKFPEKTFVFSTPAGAGIVKSFSMPHKQGSHPMVGQKAGDFSLELLNGGKVDLACHQGKHIVVLEFWATWCRPCVAALPIQVKVTDQFKNKGVVFYAINQRERPAQIKAFLKRMKLKVAVPLDKTTHVGRLYGVSGIPQTVIIDKKGIVRHVQVGVLPNLEEQLTAQLTQLTTEKDAQASRFDLMCKSILFLDQKIQVGQQVALKFVAANLGSEAVQAGTHNISLSIDNQIAYTGPVDVAIGAHGDATFLIPKDLWHVEFTKAGHYNYKLEIDSDGHINETNEENNTCLGRVEVVAAN